MKFAIRDDDMSFFTNVSEIEFAHKEILEYMPISFAVVPFSVPVHADKVRFSDQYNDYDEMPIGENREIVAYIKELIEINKAEIMLHGYSHKYKKIKNKWVPECKWKDYQRLKPELTRGKEYLESLFGEKIHTFVPPSNVINRDCIKVIEDLEMNLSALVKVEYERSFNIISINNYLKAWMYRMIHLKRYPYTLNYHGHKELVGHNLLHCTTYEKLRNELIYCKNNNANYVLATHYKDIIENKKLKLILYRLINESISLGFEPARVSECF